MEARAAVALGALLDQVSSIKRRDIQFQPVRRRSDILASIDVLGRSHKLVCSVADDNPAHARRTLRKLEMCADARRADATRVLIMPTLSAEIRALCEQRQVGFLDLEGNGRLVVDEVFIGKRSVRRVPAATDVRYQA
jgi:hypothetical protein